MAGRRTPEEQVIDKVGLWLTAYQAIIAEISPSEVQAGLTTLLNTKVTGEGEGILELDMQAYASRVNASLGLARMASANSRAAATVAALLTATGIKPAAIDYGDDA